jgi:hypothetical protein
MTAGQEVMANRAADRAEPVIRGGAAGYAMTRAVGRSAWSARAGWPSPGCGPTKEKAALHGGSSKHQWKYIEQMDSDAIVGALQVTLLNQRERSMGMRRRVADLAAGEDFAAKVGAQA